eukprot:6648647-Karenia_brevis.AAC.1
MKPIEKIAKALHHQYATIHPRTSGGLQGTSSRKSQGMRVRTVLGKRLGDIAVTLGKLRMLLFKILILMNPKVKVRVMTILMVLEIRNLRRLSRLNQVLLKPELKL